jgi:hypothetical protein
MAHIRQKAATAVKQNSHSPAPRVYASGVLIEHWDYAAHVQIYPIFSLTLVFNEDGLDSEFNGARYRSQLSERCVHIYSAPTICLANL